MIKGPMKVNNNGTREICHVETDSTMITDFETAVKAVKVDAATAADTAAACTGNSAKASVCTGNSATATKLATARTIALSGAATGTATAFDGTANITIPVTSLDATKLTGIAPKATNDKNGTDITTYLKSIGFVFPTLTATTGAGAASTYLLVPDGASAHNQPWRGKDITAYYDSGEMASDIAAGTFKGIFPGDYITKAITYNGTTYTVNWIAGDCDYHLGMGDGETTAHHVLMFAEKAIFSARMNSSNTTAGGFIGSEMWTTTLPALATSIKNAFGSDHVLTHRELLSNAMSDTIASGAGAGWTGAASGWDWYDVDVNIFNETMVYGTRVFSSSFYDVGECNSQIAAFRLNHGLIAGKRTWNWLRAVASSSPFCISDRDGDAGASDASHTGGGVRPYFLLH